MALRMANSAPVMDLWVHARGSNTGTYKKEKCNVMFYLTLINIQRLATGIDFDRADAYRNPYRNPIETL